MRGDYASPNSKVNQDAKTRINEIIHQLIENDVTYIGVTATPARLDLNNTFSNLTEKWIRFKPHDNYVGKEVFFPLDGKSELLYSLKKLPETGDRPNLIRNAIENFIVNASILNTKNNSSEKYAFLIHTSGEVYEHSKDKKDTDSYLDALIDKNNKNHKKHWQKIIENINEKVQNEIQRQDVFKYAYLNISNQCIAVLNSRNPGSPKHKLYY